MTDVTFFGKLFTKAVAEAGIRQTLQEAVVDKALPGKCQVERGVETF